MPLTLNGTTGVAGVDGSAGTPAMQGADTNTGIYYGADTVFISTGGIVRATVANSGLTLSTPLVFPAGSVSAPSITTTGDTNTGIYFPAADTIGFVEGGVEAMRLDASGNLGLGNSANERMSIFSSTANSYIQIVDSTNGGTSGAFGFFIGITNGEGQIRNKQNSPVTFYTNNTERARIDSSGTFRVKGAGTAGSTDAFLVDGAAPASAARIDSSGNLLVGTTNSSAAGRIRATYTPTSQWGLDASESTVTIANGGNATLPVGSGLVVITGQNATGSTGVYAIGGGASAIIAASDFAFVAATTTPAAGTISIAYDGANYRIYNNQGNQITFGVLLMRTRANN